jgi:pilus assembly protein Flp/PilA
MVRLYLTLLLFAGDVNDRMRREDSGATAVEYGLLVGLIAVVIIAALLLLGPQLAQLFSGVSSKVPSVT